jgi:hypothetical protein
MFKRIVIVLREQYIGNVMCGVFIFFAIKSLAAVVEAPFLNRIVHIFNTHTTEFPRFEPPIYGAEIVLKSFDFVLFAVLAWIFYRWLWCERQGESRG